MEQILGQGRYVLASFACGVILMFLYDFILVLRCLKKPGRLSLWIQDWLFWGAASVFVFQMIFELNNGILRSFFVIAFLLGMLGYRKAVETVVQRGIKLIFGVVFRPCVWIVKKIRQIRKKTLKSR